MANEIIHGKLLSTDGKLTLMVLALDPPATAQDRLAGVVDDVRKTLNEHLAGTGLNGELSGVPVMQLEIRNAIERDRLVYNSLGFAAGCLIAILFFRRVSFMIIAAAPPLSAILLALGALGWLDFSLNMFLNVMTPLIMVISFSDSMQLTFAARDRLIAGDEQVDGLSQRPAHRRAGLRAHPRHGRHFVHRLAVLAIRPDPHLRRGRTDRHRRSRWSRCCSACRCSASCSCATRRASPHHVKGMDMALDCVAPVLQLDRGAHGGAARAFTVSSASSWSIVLSLGYAQLQPRYRLADQVPDREQAVKASHRLDVKLTGANPFDVLIEFPQRRIALCARKRWR